MKEYIEEPVERHAQDEAFGCDFDTRAILAREHGPRSARLKRLTTSPCLRPKITVLIEEDEVPLWEVCEVLRILMQNRRQPPKGRLRDRA